MNDPARSRRALCRLGLHDPERRLPDTLARRLGFDRLCIDCGRVRDRASGAWTYPTPSHLKALDALREAP